MRAGGVDVMAGVVRPALVRPEGRVQVDGLVRAVNALARQREFGGHRVLGVTRRSRSAPLRRQHDIRPDSRTKKQFVVLPDVSAVAHHNAVEHHARADPRATADDARAHARVVLDDRALEDDAAVDHGPLPISAPALTQEPPRTLADAATRAPGRTSGSPVGPGTAGDGATPRTRSAEPCTNAAGVPRSSQYDVSTSRAPTRPTQAVAGRSRARQKPLCRKGSSR